MDDTDRYKVYIDCDTSKSHFQWPSSVQNALEPLDTCFVDTNYEWDYIPPYTTQNQKQIFCHRCGEAGHYRNECFRFKTRICRHFEKGFCRDGSQCPFAHGESEIRNPGIPRCVHVSYDNKGNVQFRGCMEYGHSYENCTHSGGTE